MDSLVQAAIEASLAGDFERAITINKKILASDKKNVEALNRLGCAYFGLGNFKKAQEVYRKALKIDPYNNIILKNLKRISQVKGSINNKSKGFPLKIEDLFLTEPGKTKVVSLVNLPSTNVILQFSAGAPVNLIPKRRTISVYFNDENKKRGVYLGSLPDDLSFRLLRLIKNGYRYNAYIKNVSKKNLTIIIKELSRGKKFQNQPSFPETCFYQTSSNPYQELK